MALAFQCAIVRLINEHGAIATKRSRPFLCEVVSNLDSWQFRECFFGCILSLDHIRKRSADGTPDLTEPLKIIDKLILEFIRTARAELALPNNTHMLLPDVEIGIDPRLPEGCLKVLCRFDPTRFTDIINRIYGFDHPNGEIYFTKLAAILPHFIGAYPRSVIMWTVVYRSKLQIFIKQYRDPMIMAAIIHHVDLTKTMMLDPDGTVDLLRALDDFIKDRRNIVKHQAEFPIIVERFRAENNERDLTMLAFRYAKQRDMLHCIPTALTKRKLIDFHYQVMKTSNDELAQTCLQFVSNCKTLEEKHENLVIVAKVRPKIAFAIVDALNIPVPDGLLGTLPGVFGMADVARFAKLMKDLLQQERIKEIDLAQGKVDVSGKKIRLVDHASQLPDLITWINQQSCVAFDVEANFVFQSSTGTQIATLLEVANNDECKIIDLYELKRQLTELDWRAFLTAFLRPRLTRVGHDVKNDVDFLLGAFPFMYEMVMTMKPVFSCIQKMIVYMYGEPVYRKHFKHTDSTPLALCAVVKEIFDEEMPKGLQTSNWQLRPLSRDQLIYAANDAFYTLRVHNFLTHLEVQQNPIRNHCLYRVETKIVKAEPSKNEVLTFPELLHVLESVVKDMQNDRIVLRPSHELTIVVDAPFFKAVPKLRQIGFITWDHRDNKEEPLIRNAAQASVLFRKKLVEIIENNTVNSTYVLSNRKNIFDMKTSIFENRLILDNQEQAMPALLTNLIRKAQASIDFSEAAIRCATCSNTKDILDVPMSAFRLFFKSFANVKGFGDTIPEIVGDLEDDYVAVEKLNDWTCEREDRITYNKDGLIIKFPLDNVTKLVAVTKPGFDERNIPLKCNTKIIRETNLTTVKFCYHCGLTY